MNHFFPVSYLLLDVHAGLPSALSCQLLYDTTIFFRSPRTLPPPPPPPPQLPLRSIISSLPNQIHFSPSPGTSFHFINLSHLKLNESPAWFLLFFFIPACSFYNSPTHPPPGFSTPPLDFACPPLWMLPHAERVVGEHIIPQRRLCQLLVLGAESRSPRPWVQSRGSVPLQD